MQVFVPYPSPIDVARTMENDKLRIRKQVIEGYQILASISGASTAWFNHPVVKMYSGHSDWLHLYVWTLDAYINGKRVAAYEFSRRADKIRPPFLTDAFCDQHKRRLYTKSPGLYPQFASYGKSEENWYVVDGVLLKY